MRDVCGPSAESGSDKCRGALAGTGLESESEERCAALVRCFAPVLTMPRRLVVFCWSGRCSTRTCWRCIVVLKPKADSVERSFNYCLIFRVAFFKHCFHRADSKMSARVRGNWRCRCVRVPVVCAVASCGSLMLRRERRSTRSFCRIRILQSLNSHRRFVQKRARSSGGSKTCQKHKNTQRDRRAAPVESNESYNQN